MFARKSLGAGVGLLLVATSACFNQPKVDARSLRCKSDENCPSAYVCSGASAGVVGACVRPGADGAVEDVPGNGGLTETGSDTRVLGNDVSTAGATGTGGAAGQGGADGAVGDVPGNDVLTEAGPDMPFVGNDASLGGATATGGVASQGGATGTGGTTSTAGVSGTGGAGLAPCPTLANPSNGSVSVPSTTVGSLATYTCSSGYQPPTPSKERTCQSDGTWSGVVPTCIPVDCGPPPAVTNASVSRAATTYGSSAAYACDAGYALSGTSSLTCQADATWSRPGPTCTIVDCGSPPKIPNGSVSAARTTYLATATYTCDVGNVFSGATTTRACQADGTWSTPVPACTVQMLTLTISKPGPGAGGVISADAGISCGTTCSATYAYGAAVTLTATPDANQSFVGWSGAGCAGKGRCSFTITSDTTAVATFSPAPNIVFVTSTTHNAALGGLAGADTLCKERAQAAGLSGTYQAWLSTSTVNAKDRLGTASGWVRPDGKPVLNHAGDIASNRFFYPVRLDESGTDVGNVWVWTATSSDGARVAYADSTTCADFTTATPDPTRYVYSGLASSVGVEFTSRNLLNCDSELHLYCFGTDRTAVVSVDPATTGRHAFASLEAWSPGTGIASADALCQREASAANLPGTYKALLASAGASAASRFNANGTPWIRSDGIPLTSSASGFFSAAFWDAALNVTADGQKYLSGGLYWSGAGTMTTAGTNATTCSNWQSVTPTAVESVFGVQGESSALYFFGSTHGDCASTGVGLVCLQE